MSQLTDAEVDKILSEPIPFDAARDRRVAERFKQKWIYATAQANHELRNVITRQILSARVVATAKNAPRSD